MTDFNYREYSIEQLENFLHDALHEASPQEIYDVIKKVVEENYYYHKDHTSRSYELLALLNGNGKGHITGYDPKEPLVCDKDNKSPECKGAWDDFWGKPHHSEEHDKVKKWVLPVEEHTSGEYYVQFPDDLLKRANLKENDLLEWIPQEDGSYLLKKVSTNSKTVHPAP
jgi:hypothetical protein